MFHRVLKLLLAVIIDDAPREEMRVGQLVDEAIADPVRRGLKAAYAAAKAGQSSQQVRDAFLSAYVFKGGPV